jgi:hypothetical protein
VLCKNIDVHKLAPRKSQYLITAEDRGQSIMLKCAKNVRDLALVQLSNWGGYGSIMMGIGLMNLAQSYNIGQYQTFVVDFTSRGTTQKFRYNNFSGAWSISPRL